MKMQLAPVLTLAATMSLHTAVSQPAPGSSEKVAGSPAASEVGIVDLGNNAKLEMVRIKGGSFEMGCKDGDTDQKPVHTVTVKGFWMGKFEVTQAQWQAIMGSNPSKFKGDDLPVDSLSWYLAAEFCKKVSAKTGRNFALPTEAQWEYACRAGTKTDYSNGKDSSMYLKDYGWFGDSSGTPHPAGQKKPNPWGLYDMHGNVFEWCADVYVDNYEGAPTDGSARTGDGKERVARSGAWLSSGSYCSSVFRCHSKPDAPEKTMGLRVVRTD